MAVQVQVQVVGDGDGGSGSGIVQEMAHICSVACIVLRMLRKYVHTQE